MAFTLPQLPYAHEALEPYIDAATMQIHHGKHHQAYVDNLNKAIAGTEHENKSLGSNWLLLQVQYLLPFVTMAAVTGTTVFSGKYLVQHAGEGSNRRALSEAINSTFGSLDGLKEKVNAAGATRFGSGWAWLIVKDGKLGSDITPNQDNPLMDVAEVKGTPILGIDVWEHAYYLKYQNRRPEYLGAVWNVINWKKVAENFSAAK